MHNRIFHVCPIENQIRKILLRSYFYVASEQCQGLNDYSISLKELIIELTELNEILEEVNAGTRNFDVLTKYAQIIKENTVEVSQ